MYTISELTYIADNIAHAPGASIYDDVMSAMCQVRDQALQDSALLEQRIAGLEADRDALRAQLINANYDVTALEMRRGELDDETETLRAQLTEAHAGQWQPVENGSYPTDDPDEDITVVDDSLQVYGTDEVGEGAYAIVILPTNLRLCRRVPAQVAGPGPTTSG